jgi:hypothetical protein
MGSVKKYLFKSDLSEREEHHSRLFVDLAENIHIHHREFRTVFSLDEYFEYADIIAKSTIDVRNFLGQNSNYEEGEYPTTIMIAGGRERQLKFLQNSPKPNESNYFANEFAIELQDEYVTDEIHIHYRDFRIALDRTRFREVANGFYKALLKLDEFEASNNFIRKSHADRIIHDFNQSNNQDNIANQMGIQKIPLVKIKSYWHNDIESDWKPDKEAISMLIDQYNKTGYFAPIILSTEANGDHLIIDGHHRFYSAKKMQLPSIDTVVTKISFSDSEKIRAAEVLLKEFDIETNYKYELSSFLKSYLGFKLNRYYTGVYNKNMKKMKLWYRILRRIKWAVFGKGYVFKIFNEAHNK